MGVDDHRAEFFQQFFRLQQDELSGFPIPMQGRIGNEHQGQGAHMVWVHFREGAAGFTGVNVRTLRTGQAEDDGHVQLDAGLSDFPSLGDDFGRIHFFTDALQRCIIPRFQTHINDAQAEGLELSQLFRGFALQAFCIGIDAHPRDPGKSLSDFCEYPE